MQFLYVDPIRSKEDHLKPKEPKKGSLWGVWIRVADISKIEQYNTTCDDGTFGEKNISQENNYDYEITKQDGEIIRTATNLIQAMRNQILNPPKDDGSYDFPSP